ncbi:hypothetical protein M0Q50_03420 [bacterium]|jgi:hypothetical protein|nr:hypothetical protein [bacterium]
MKVGDKLLCKKKFNFDRYYNFEVGKYYMIDNIFEESNHVRIKLDTGQYTAFCLRGNMYCGNINDYFYTKDTLRIEKLKSI